MICENGHTELNNILINKCSNNKATHKILIKYDKLSTEQDELKLCAECTIQLLIELSEVEKIIVTKLKEC